MMRDARGVLHDLGPQVGRAHQHTYGTRAVVGGTFDFGARGSVDAQRLAQRIHKAKLAAAEREIRRVGL